MKLKLYGILVCILLFYLMSIPLHEWGHYWASEIMGGESSITFPTPVSGFIHTSNLESGIERWLFGFAGGFTVFAVFLLLWIQARWSPTKWDLDDEFALAIVGSCQLVYAFFEACSPDLASSWIMAPVSMTVATIVGVAYLNPLLGFLSHKDQ